MRTAAVASALLASLSLTHAAPTVLGRAEGGPACAAVSARFVTADLDDILVATREGVVRVALSPGQAAQPVRLYRLTLYRQSAAGLAPVWQSEPLLGTADSLLTGPWAVADVDGDARAELLVFSPESCLVVQFESDTLDARMVPMSGAAIEAAAWCDPAGNGQWCLAALEAPTAAAPSTRVLGFWGWTAAGLARSDLPASGFNWGDSTTAYLLGAARLEDYAGTLPVIAGVHSAIRPSTYCVGYSSGLGTTFCTSRPFPRRDWFAKTEVLPSGPLALYNVGDTLVAYGYFVPGSRPAGPDRSFAALQDGEWRLLPVTADAARVAGPVCPFSWQGQAGWLECRDGLLYFYPDGVFTWR